MTSTQDHDNLNLKARRPFFMVAVCFCVGIVLSVYMDQPVALVAVVMLGIGVGYACCPGKAKGICLMVMVAGWGWLYAASYVTPPKNHISHVYRYSKDPVMVRGRVVSDIEEKKQKIHKRVFMFELQSLRYASAWRPVTGTVLVQSYQPVPFGYGDVVVLEGKLHRPFDFSEQEHFSYPQYLKQKGVYFILSVSKERRMELIENKNHRALARIYRWRRALGEALARYLTINESGLMRAMLLGDRSNIPSHIREIFVRTGTAHILAISGLHIGAVAAMIYLCLNMLPLPRKISTFLTMAALFVFMIMVGGRPSIVRATVMSLVVLGSFLFERESDSLNALGLAAMILLFLNPMVLFDIGFQLSFVSVMSILRYYPLFMNLFQAVCPRPQQRWWRGAARIFAVSLAAYAGVEGLIMYYFEIVTPVALVANLVVVPLMTLTVTLGLGLMVTGGLWPLAAGMLASCLKIVLNSMVLVAFLFSKIPGAFAQPVVLPLWATVFYYVVILIILPELIGRIKLETREAIQYHKTYGSS